MDVVYTILGLIGVAMTLAAYALLTRGVLSRDGTPYYWLNILSTFFIAASLASQWNLAAAVSQTLWFIISVIGLIRVVRRRV